MGSVRLEEEEKMLSKTASMMRRKMNCQQINNQIYGLGVPWFSTIFRHKNNRLISATQHFTWVRLNLEPRVYFGFIFGYSQNTILSVTVSRFKKKASRFVQNSHVKWRLNAMIISLLFLYAFVFRFYFQRPICISDRIFFGLFCLFRANRNTAYCP